MKQDLVMSPSFFANIFLMALGLKWSHMYTINTGLGPQMVWNPTGARTADHVEPISSWFIPIKVVKRSLIEVADK